MEETPEGLAAAKATRELAKEAAKHAQQPPLKRAAEGASGPASKKPAKDKVANKCTHEVTLPDNYNESANALDPNIHGTIHDPVYQGTMAKQYPFTLDTFQSTAIACLERKESVLVAAHTSAGKTVVAEYAIAMAFREKQRVVYTSPIKALSNQKFRELSEEFEDVGIMTGDVTINPNASCLVMTTEILRSMIYRKGELMEEMAWVVFDEVHYMQDRERGVVWEETIIFLPRQIRMVFLSATLSNANQFASWVTHLHSQPCHVVYTDTRPTPLMHMLYPLPQQGVVMVKNANGVFLDKGYQKAMEAFGAPEEGNGEGGDGEGGGGGGGGVHTPAGAASGAGRGRGMSNGNTPADTTTPGSAKSKGPHKKGPSDIGAGIVRIVKYAAIEKNDKDLWTPIILFSFARRECELYSRILSKEVDLTTEEEKGYIEQVFTNATQCLSTEDQQLPFLQSMLPILQRGIGVHHGGLLPILKELVELLFSESLIKVLFATETFAMGLNMPAKTVVFTALKKYDGESMRYMTSGEYIQMSGRAGRRGKDDSGLVIMMVEERLPKETLQSLLQGTPGPLNSQFKLSYFTLLNVLRRQGSTENMEYVIKNSFQQFQWEQQLPSINAQLANVQQELHQMESINTTSVEEYLTLRATIAKHEATLLQAMLRPDKSLHFLTPGRLIKVKEGQVEWGWGVVVAVNRATSSRAMARGTQPSADAVGGAAAGYTVDTLLKCSKQHAGTLGTRPQPAQSPDDADMHVIPVPLPLVHQISLLRITIPHDLRQAESRRAVLVSVNELEKKYAGSLPPLDPMADMHIDDPAALEALKDIKQAEEALMKNEYASTTIATPQNTTINTTLNTNTNNTAALADKLTVFRLKAALLAEADMLRAKLSESHVMAFRDEVRRRTAVLIELGHIQKQEGVVTKKGQAACEIDTADELLTTELMFNDVFGGLDIHQLAALVSCLVPVERTQDAVKLSMTLAEPLRRLQDTARHIAEASNKCKIKVDEDEYVESFKPVLMDVIYAWSKGESFAKICSMTALFEGSIIRATRRLVELMHQMEAAARVVGDTELADTFAASVATIKRDIMFAASLYI